MTGRTNNRARYCSPKCKDLARTASHQGMIAARRVGRTCERCGDPIAETAPGKTKFCSRKCLNDHHNHARAADIKVAIIEQRKPCRVCDGPIPPEARSDVIYCSPRCKSRGNQYGSSPQRDYNRWYLYGLSPKQYAAMLAEQDGRCAICRTDEWRGKDNAPHVDHDHDSKYVRGILCGGCNNGLGSFGDDPARLRAAADYLERNMR